MTAHTTSHKEKPMPLPTDSQAVTKANEKQKMLPPSIKIARVAHLVGLLRIIPSFASQPKGWVTGG